MNLWSRINWPLHIDTHFPVLHLGSEADCGFLENQFSAPFVVYLFSMPWQLAYGTMYTNQSFVMRGINGLSWDTNNSSKDRVLKGINLQFTGRNASLLLHKWRGRSCFIAATFRVLHIGRGIWPDDNINYCWYCLCCRVCALLMHPPTPIWTSLCIANFLCLTHSIYNLFSTTVSVWELKLNYLAILLWHRRSLMLLSGWWNVQCHFNCHHKLSPRKTNTFWKFIGLQGKSVNVPRKY